MAILRVDLVVSEPLSEGSPKLRVPLVVSEPLSEGAPKLREALLAVEPLSEGRPKLREALLCVETLTPDPEEPFMATLVFPTAGLRGLTWERQKSPQFNDALRKTASGRKSVTAYMQFPWWNFELNYSVLDDIDPGSSGYTALRTVQGFFLQCQARAKTFLYQDPDDFHALAEAQAIADGTTLQFPFVRDFGGFVEPIGQVDLSQLASFPASAVNTGTSAIHVVGHGLTTGQGPLWIANTGGALPTGLVADTAYWAIAVDADHFQLASSLANALAATPISLTGAGSGTDSLTKGVAVYDNGTLQGPTAWSLSLPNQIVFASAPTAGHAITADFDFWFVCRFTEETYEFDQFMSKLWDLKKLTFQSEIQ
ncbi:MAG TPA: DUF2460 domain-containing protein [Caulobacteraceae bacterium]|jgi:hypothetical protein